MISIMIMIKMIIIMIMVKMIIIMIMVKKLYSDPHELKVMGVRINKSRLKYISIDTKSLFSLSKFKTKHRHHFFSMSGIYRLAF